MPYDGVMPAPEGLKSLIRRLWWDFFIQEDTIRTVLQQVYIDRCTPATWAFIARALGEHKLPPCMCCSISPLDCTVQEHSLQT